MMKCLPTPVPWVLLGGCVLLLLSGTSPTVEAQDLVVVVENLQSDEGLVVFSLYPDQEAFKQKTPLHTWQTVPSEGRASWTLPDLPPGAYAVQAFHDLNANGRLDRSKLGLPREPVGMSNNPVLIGPPSFRHARFTLGAEGGSQVLRLSTPTDSASRWRMGAGAVVRSKVYLGQDSASVTGLPFLSYFGERFFIAGPFAGVRLFNRGQTQLNLNAAYRFDGYEESDSKALTGMGDRDGTVEMGFTLSRKLPGRFALDLRASHDILDTYGSGRASLDLERTFGGKDRLISLSIGPQWQSSDLVDYYYGVRPGEATEARPAYLPGDALNFSAGARLIQSLWDRLDLFLAFSYDWLNDEIADSPIVGKDYLLSTITGLTYRF